MLQLQQQNIGGNEDLMDEWLALLVLLSSNEGDRVISD